MRRTSILAARAFKRRLVDGRSALAPTTQSTRSAVTPPPQNQSSVGPTGTPAAGGFMGAIAEGFAFGVGSSIARSMVGSLWPSGGGGGDSTSATPPAPPPDNSGFSHNYDADQNKGSGGGDGGDDDDDLF